MTVRTDGPEKPFAIPSRLLDGGLEPGQFDARPSGFGGQREAGGDLRVRVEAEADLKRHHDGFAIVAHFHAVVPVGVKAAGQAVFSGTLEIEFKGPTQMTEHGGLASVGVRQNFPVEIDVPGLGHVVGHGVEEPLAVIGAELRGLRGLLVSGPVREGFDHGHCATGSDLTGEHELEAFADLFLHQRHDAEEILHGVAEAETIAFTVVDHGSVARPSVGDERVVAAPDIGHVVEVRIRSLDRDTGEQPVPVCLELLQLSFTAHRAGEFRNRGPAVRSRCADPEKNDEFAGLAGLEGKVRLERAAAVLALGEKVRAPALRDGAGIGVGVVNAAKEIFADGLIAGNGRISERHPRATAFVEPGGVEWVVRV